VLEFAGILIIKSRNIKYFQISGAISLERLGTTTQPHARALVLSFYGRAVSFFYGEAMIFYHISTEIDNTFYGTASNFYGKTLHFYRKYYISTENDCICTENKLYSTEQA
jgi:hypothetical protein